ncbi:MAG: DUF5522 domain-containing protein [Ginsengibacter sp.]|jgi:hypothetical protein
MKNEQFKEGIDFYFDENGLMVMTEKYHLERGYCCGNGCRHCPYKHENVKSKITSKKSGKKAR